MKIWDEKKEETFPEKIHEDIIDIKIYVLYSKWISWNK